MYAYCKQCDCTLCVAEEILITEVVIRKSINLAFMDGIYMHICIQIYKIQLYKINIVKINT